jgi:copper resistance protein B
MKGMDHSQMNHSSATSPTTTSRTPIPVLTDADRESAFPPGWPPVHDSGINSFFLLDQLEYQDADEGSTLAWGINWRGGDINRFWVRRKASAPMG